MNQISSESPAFYWRYYKNMVVFFLDNLIVMRTCFLLLEFYVWSIYFILFYFVNLIYLFIDIFIRSFIQSFIFHV